MTAARVRPMTVQEFERWRERSQRDYAADVARASGCDAATAQERAERSFAELLPHGLDTARTWLLRVLDDDGAPVGVLWLGPHPQRPDAAYVFDVEIDAERRGRGLGRAAMLAAEEQVRAAGITELSLNVFGFNERARRLYDALGYRVVSTQLSKTLA